MGRMRLGWVMPDFRLHRRGVFVPRAGDQETLTASVRLGPPLVDVQRRPHRAALFLEDSDGHQGNDAVATKQSLLLGAPGQVGGSANLRLPGGCILCSQHGERFLYLSLCIKGLFLSSCRLIYFGGYGCKTMGEMQNTPATNFILEDMSWVMLGGGVVLEELLSLARS